MLIPLGNLYHARRLAPVAETAGGLALPETAQWPTWDAEVLARGPGRTERDGSLTPMQARVGDRIIARKNDWQTVEGEEGFVRDTALVAVVRMPDYDRVEPVGEYVLVQPERHQHLRETASGLVVAGYAAQGQDVRDRQRGQELYEELGRLGKSQRYLEQPTTYYRHRLVWGFCDALAGWELDALKAAIKANGDTKWDEHEVFRLRDRPKAGVVVQCAQGRFARGERVHFDREWTGVDLGTHGLAIDAKYLAAVEVESRAEVLA